MTNLMDEAGNFIGLPDEALAQLTSDQRSAYERVKSAAATVAATNAEVDAATVDVHAAHDAVRAAQEAERQRPAWTFGDEFKAMIAANRRVRGLS